MRWMSEETWQLSQRCYDNTAPYLHINLTGTTVEHLACICLAWPLTNQLVRSCQDCMCMHVCAWVCVCYAAGCSGQKHQQMQRGRSSLAHYQVWNETDAESERKRQSCWCRGHTALNVRGRQCQWLLWHRSAFSSSREIIQLSCSQPCFQNYTESQVSDIKRPNSREKISLNKRFQEQNKCTVVVLKYFNNIFSVVFKMMANSTENFITHCAI